MIKSFSQFNESYVHSDQFLLEDILCVNESSVDFHSILKKVKKYALKGVLTTSILTSLLSTKSFSQEQKEQIKKVANISISKEDISKITPEMRNEWNNFIDWIAKNYPEGISDKGSDPTNEIVAAYQKYNPKTSIQATNIAKFQKDLVQYNTKWKTLQVNYHEKGDYISVPSIIDNRIGSITSKMEYPNVSLIIQNKKINFGTDIDAAINASNEDKKDQVYIDPTLTPAQRFQKNQERRAKGLPLITNREREQQLKADTTKSNG